MALYELCWHVVHGGLKVDVASSLLSDVMVSFNTSLETQGRVIQVSDLAVTSAAKSPDIHADARVQPNTDLFIF